MVRPIICENAMAERWKRARICEPIHSRIFWTQLGLDPSAHYDFHGIAYQGGGLGAGGFDRWKTLSEVDPINFAPHIKVSVLMLNGTIRPFYFLIAAHVEYASEHRHAISLML